MYKMHKLKPDKQVEGYYSAFLQKSAENFYPK